MKQLKIQPKHVKSAVVLALGAVAMASPLLAFASAQDAGAVAANVTGNFGPIAKFLTGGGYVVGAGAVLHGLHKFWQKSHDNQGQIKAGHYTIPVVAGGALIAFAATAGVPVATLFGGGVNSNTAGVNGSTTY